MNIWVDADACPVAIKEILYRAADKRKIATTFVANQLLKIPNSTYLDFIQVEAGFDVADNKIVKMLKKDDLVITADIPLAVEVIEKEALALNPRGELYTKENVRAKLNMRDFMETMRSGGLVMGGPPPLNNRDKQNFANQLDRLLTKHQKNSQKD